MLPERALKDGVTYTQTTLQLIVSQSPEQVLKERGRSPISSPGGGTEGPCIETEEPEKELERGGRSPERLNVKRP